jgi:hypothetical protein
MQPPNELLDLGPPALIQMHARRVT